ncbi:YwiC-like family protein [Bacillus tianshenii]|nr:YwiC-like family protein [Bacillus tianshenii]
MIIPKQHGAWVMLVVPFLAGMFISNVSWLHIPLFIGWFFIYLGTYCFLEALKRSKKKRYIMWGIRYYSIVLASLAVVIVSHLELLWLGVAVVPLFLINIYYAKQKNERAFLNDLSAIIIFSLGGSASYLVGGGGYNSEMLLMNVSMVLFFTGSVFFVKTFVREKKNPRFKQVSYSYHIGVLVCTSFLTPLFLIAYLPSAIRSAVFSKKSLTPKQLGIIEFVNVSYFLLFIIYIF